MSNLINTPLTSEEILSNKDFFKRQIMQSFESLANIVNTGNKGVKCDSFRAGRFEFIIGQNAAPAITANIQEQFLGKEKGFKIDVSFSTGFGNATASELLQFAKLVEEVAFAKSQAERSLEIHQEKFLVWEEAAWATAIN